MDYVIQSLNNVSFKLKIEHDFTWLTKYGEVFKVFDENDSGNICFGVQKNHDRYFIKYAGAQTYALNKTPQEAVIALKKAEEIYKVLHHYSLVEYLYGENVGEGYALVFRWREGGCMNDHWAFEHRLSYKGQANYMRLVKDEHLDSPTYQFRQLSYERRSVIYREILMFHKYVIDQGYMAIDFYDGSIMYDFARDILTICDIDYYRVCPSVNDMGRMWGSSRFMSPEELIFGETLDEVTNVFNLGAFAFFVFGNERVKTFKHWKASRALYEFAQKAMAAKPEARYQSIAEMIEVYDALVSIESFK